MYYSTTYQSPIGLITLASDGKSLNGLWVEGQKYFPNTFNENFKKDDNMPVLNLTKEWLDRYFNREKIQIYELPLSPSGSDFRQQVWKILCEIPYGEVITYKDIAEKMKLIFNREKMSCQAIGGAVGHNPISIVIPCHRVVGSNGSLTGYASGIERKIELLKLEGVDVSKFTE